MKAAERRQDEATEEINKTHKLKHARQDKLGKNSFIANFLFHFDEIDDIMKDDGVGLGAGW